MTDAPIAIDATAPDGAKVSAELVTFTFGDPEPVLNSRSLLGLDHIECWRNGRWYAPPIDFGGLARSRHASPHHASAMMVKANLLTSHFVPSRMLSRETFKAAALDRLVLANCYFERRDNLVGGPLRLERPVAKYVRRGVEAGEFFYVTHGAYGALNNEYAFAKGSVLQLKEADIDQEIYGVPEYLAALQSAWLNEAATIFRRRYYTNGSHAGFIMYMTDPAHSEADIEALREALKNSKGPGNFRNLFMYAPNGKKDGLQLIPVSEVAAKDEFIGIKNTSRDDILAAHRVPPQLLGVVPANAGGFGDVGKANDVFFRNEIEPLQAEFLAINEWLGSEVVRFRDYEPMSKTPAPAAA